MTLSQLIPPIAQIHLPSSAEVNATEILTAIVVGSEDAIISKNLDGLITTWNHGAEKIFGYTVTEAIGSSIEIILPSTLLEEEKKILRQIIRGKKISHFVAERVCKDGAYITMSISISPILNQNSRVVGVSKIARDITSQKNSEAELLIANRELIYQAREKAKRAAELVLANKELAYQNKEKASRASELAVANQELAFQNKEKDKRVNELVIANEEKAKRAAELILANKELLFQSSEKANRASELLIANDELAFQNKEKDRRVDELVLANEEKAKRAAELVLANKELLYQGEEKAKRAAELVLANKELLYQSIEKVKRAAELLIANKELEFQNKEKDRRVAELVLANEEKAKRAAELVVATKEQQYQGQEKEKRAAELVIANKELLYQGGEKAKRAAELVVANEELFYQGGEKAKRAAELVIANKELEFQNKEKDRRLAELVLANDAKAESAAELLNANKALLAQSLEKDKRAAELIVANEAKDHLKNLNSEKLRRSLMETIAIARQIGELRDPYTAGHEKHVGDMAREIAKKLGFDENKQEGIMIAGYLHDIGKIVVPVEILCKPGKITAQELNLIKNHVQAGFDILKDVSFPWDIARAVLEHHERLDGSGYPNQLMADQISIEGRILAVVDVLDAMSSFRPYRPALGMEPALAEIRKGRGIIYDSIVVDACIELVEEGRNQLPAQQKTA